MDDKYKIVGTVAISEKNKETVNKYVLEILCRCGIRKTGKMLIADREISVLYTPKADETGIVTFDYSIFEKRRRNCSTYNTNTCELISYDRGYNEFGIVMNMIMFLLEAYSEEPCYVLCDNKLFYMTRYMALIKDVLDIDLRFPNREKLWSMLIFFRKNGYGEITGQEIWNKFSCKYMSWNMNQVYSVLLPEREEIGEVKHLWDGTKESLADLKTIELGNKSYEIYIKLIPQEAAAVRRFLQILITSPLAERKKLSEKNDDYGCLAYISLYVLPAQLIAPYAMLTKEDFWTVFDDFTADKKAYTDVIVNDNDIIEAESIEKYPFYKAIMRDNMDEFLGIQRVDDKLLSTELKEHIEEWRKEFQKIRMGNVADFKGKEVEVVVKDLVETWNLNDVPYDFIDNCIRNSENEDYQKAVLILQRMISKYEVYFPELTRKQKIEWLIRPCKEMYNEKLAAAYMQLMADDNTRKEMLGF